jgi:hypothetical protein
LIDFDVEDYRKESIKKEIGDITYISIILIDYSIKDYQKK